jgi:hypothetical protein
MFLGHHGKKRRGKPQTMNAIPIVIPCRQFAIKNLPSLGSIAFLTPYHHYNIGHTTGYEPISQKDPCTPTGTKDIHSSADGFGIYAEPFGTNWSAVDLKPTSTCGRIGKDQPIYILGLKPRNVLVAFLTGLLNEIPQTCLSDAPFAHPTSNYAHPSTHVLPPTYP